MRFELIKLFIILLFICIVFHIYAQKESINWHIGFNASVDFSTGVPKSLTNTPNNTGWGRGCATISNSTGSLLFYTYGRSIINKNHQIMQNGDSILGAEYSQSVIIVPKPGSTNIYYVVTVGGLTTQTGYVRHGLHYSEVDMTLDNGLGAIVSSKKNIKLLDVAYGNLTYSIHYDSVSFWVVTYNGFSQNYYSFLVDSNGVDNQAIISKGKHHEYDSTFYYWGELSISHNGSYIANIGCAHNLLMLHNFNNRTGKVDTSFTFNEYFELNPIGLEFSPSNKLVYVSAENMHYNSVYQYDLEANDIKASRVTLAEQGYNDTLCFFYVQLGPDRKIYCPVIGSNYISMIKYPDLLGFDCEFVNEAIVFDGITTPPYNQAGNLIGCVPQIVPFVFYTDFIYNYTCLGNETEFHIQASNYDSLFWSFGDPLSGSDNYSYNDNPVHIYTDIGTYNIILQVYFNGYADTVIKSLTVCDLNFDLGTNPTVLCDGESITLKPNVNNATYLWSNGLTTDEFTTSNAGHYWVEISKEYCTKRNEIELISQNSPPLFSLGNDTVICIGETVCLKSLEGNFDYLWQDGSLSPNYLVAKEGDYYVLIANYCGEQSDTIYFSEEDCNCQPYFPTAFTPNGDGLNDVFMPLSVCNFERYTFQIYSRWGEKIFETEDVNEVWDGRFKNEELPNGVYVYKLVYQISNTSNLRNRQGSVLLNR